MGFVLCRRDQIRLQWHELYATMKSIKFIFFSCSNPSYSLHFVDTFFYYYYYYLASRLNAMRADKSVFVYVFHIITLCAFVCFSRYSLLIYFLSPFYFNLCRRVQIVVLITAILFSLCFLLLLIIPSNRFIEYQHLCVCVCLFIWYGIFSSPNLHFLYTWFKCVWSIVCNEKKNMGRLLIWLFIKR